MLIYAHIVDHNILKVFVKNNINYVISLSRKVKLKMIIDYETTKCYVIDFFEHNFIAKASKRSPNWIKLDLRKLIIAITTFIAVMTSIIAKEVYVTKIIFYDTSEIKSSISIMINEFPFLWQNTESVKNVSESKWINISLFDNWRELYKLNQARVYSLD